MMIGHGHNHGKKIPDAILIIPQILGKGKASPPKMDYCCGKMESVYGINLPRIMRIIIIDVVCKGINCIPVVCLNIWSFTKHQ